MELTTFCLVAINKVCALTFRCVSCNLLLTIKCWRFFFQYELEQIDTPIHLLLVSFAFEGVFSNGNDRYRLRVGLEKLHITWGLLKYIHIYNLSYIYIHVT